MRHLTVNSTTYYLFSAWEDEVYIMCELGLWDYFIIENT